jgi:hypothetical protein
VAAAGSLTINVGKAWDNGISLQDGEGKPVAVGFGGSIWTHVNNITPYRYP